MMYIDIGDDIFFFVDIKYKCNALYSSILGEYMM